MSVCVCVCVLVWALRAGPADIAAYICYARIRKRHVCYVISDFGWSSILDKSVLGTPMFGDQQLLQLDFENWPV